MWTRDINQPDKYSPGQRWQPMVVLKQTESIVRGRILQCRAISFKTKGVFPLWYLHENSQLCLSLCNLLCLQSCQLWILWFQSKYYQSFAFALCGVFGMSISYAHTREPSWRISSMEVNTKKPHTAQMFSREHWHTSLLDIIKEQWII